MALPAGITTCVVTAGAPLDFAGTGGTVTLTVTPVLGGNASNIVWQATGQPLVNFPMSNTADAGAVAQVVVPHVDQAGFIDGSGNAFTNWSYRATITFKGSNRQTVTWTKNFQAPQGQSTIDLDLVPDGSITSATSAPVQPVTSFVGITGAITDADLASAVTSGETANTLEYTFAPQRPDRAPKVDAPLLVTTPVTVTKNLEMSMFGHDEATGIYYGKSNTNGHYVTSPDAVTWTDRTYSPATYTPNVICFDFDETYMYAYSSDGRIWRAPLDVFNTWTEVTVPNVPAGTTGRPGSLCALGGGVLLYGNYNTTSVDGSHIWRSADAGDTWTMVVNNPAGKHTHCIRRSPHTGIVWATIGDFGFEGAGLWNSTDQGQTWTHLASNDYGIDMVFYPPLGGRPSLVIMEGDGLNRPLLMGFWEDGQAGDKVFPLTWYSGAPSDPNSTRGTVRGIALTDSLDVIFFTTTEGGAVGSKSGLYISQGPDFTNTKLLYDTTGAEPVAYQQTAVTESTAYNYRWSFPTPKFAEIESGGVVPNGSYERTQPQPGGNLIHPLAVDPNHPGANGTGRLWGWRAGVNQVGYTDDDGQTWTDVMALPSSLTTHTPVQIEFSTNYMWWLDGLGSTGQIGRLWRSPLPGANATGLAWTKVFDLNALANGPGGAAAWGPAGTCFRNQSFAIQDDESYAYLLEYASGSVTASPITSSFSDGMIGLGSDLLYSPSGAGNFKGYLAATTFPITIPGAGAAGADLVTTIKEVLSNKLVRLADPAQTAVTGAAVTFGSATLNSNVWGGPSLHTCANPAAADPATITWSRTAAWPYSKHGHAVKIINGTPWVALGDISWPSAGWGSYTGPKQLGLWAGNGPEATAFAIKFGAGEGGVDSINFFPVFIDGVPCIVCESDDTQGFGPIGFPMQDPDAQFGSGIPMHRPPFPYVGTMRGMTFLPDGSMIYLLTGEMANKQPLDTIVLSIPPFDDCVILDSAPVGEIYNTVIGNGFYSNGYIWMGAWRIKVPSWRPGWTA